MAEEKGSFYSTYSYYNEGLKEAIEIELAMRNAPSHGKGDFALARQAGFYFEAKLYDFLYKKYNQYQKEEKKYTPSQRSAIEFFSSESSKGAIRLKHYVEAAAGEATKQISKKLDKLGREVEKVITNIATQDSSGRGNPFGDLQISVPGQVFTFELKWQSSKKAPTRWFSRMSDRKLFGDRTFYQFLTQKRDQYWTHKIDGGYWKRKICTEGLKEFLNSDSSPAGKTAREQIEFFLKKGENTESLKKEVGTKIIVHAGYTGLQITNFDTLVSNMTENAKQSKQLGQVFSHKKLLLYTNSEKQPIAGFGVDEYRNAQNKKRKEEVISFAFYVSQKLLNEKAEFSEFKSE